MFVFHTGTMLELVRKNWETQFSFLMNLSNNMVSTSMRLGDMQIQATRKFLEESSDAFKKSMQIRAFGDAQLFIVEQSQLAIQRMYGYRQNVHNIATENWVYPGKPLTNHLIRQTAQTNSNSNDVMAKDTDPQKNSGARGAHETDHRPSPLIEKLVASVAPDTDKLH